VQKEKEKEKFEMQASQPLPGTLTTKRNENTKNKRKGVVISLGNLTTISPALRPSERKHQNLPATSGMPSHLHTYATLCVNGNRCFSANYAQFGPVF
jgi:hypothetical protein